MPLIPAEVLVWQLCLDLPDAEIAALAKTLSSDEATRANGYRLDRDRRRFVAARGQLRMILGRTLDCPPREVLFGYTPFGKPYLCGNPGRLRFNLSHSDDLALVALAWDCEVGVDIELIRPDMALEFLAARFLPSAEAATLLTLTPENRSCAFFQTWTRHEAYFESARHRILRATGRPPV